MLNLNHNYLYNTNNNKKVITVSVQLCVFSGTIISDRCFCIIIYYLYVTFQLYLLKVTLGDTLN